MKHPAWRQIVLKWTSRRDYGTLTYTFVRQDALMSEFMVCALLLTFVRRTKDSERFCIFICLVGIFLYLYDRRC